MISPPRAPVLFVGHGAPTLAIDSEKGAPLRAWGSNLPRPEAVLIFSAHWETEELTLGAQIRLPLIHDYWGFPAALGQVEYPAPGAPELAHRVQELLGPLPNAKERGLDHGVWTPLVHLLPGADVPVLQLSLPATRSSRELLQLGRQLAPLRQEGVWIVGSGSLTHNLRRLRPDGTAPSLEVRGFDNWIADRLRRGDVDSLARAPELHSDFRRHHPSPEHWNVLLPVLGAWDPSHEPASFPVEGFEFGELSRRSFQGG